MHLFNHLKLRTRLVLIVLLPLIGFLYFSIDSIREKYAVTVEMTKLESLANLSVRIGALAHELQKERGMSAGFLASKGTKFVSEIQAQRMETDKRNNELKKMAKGLDLNQFGPSMRNSITEAVKSTEGIDAIRSSISGQTIASPDATGYYTHVIEKLFVIPNRVMTLSSDIEIMRPSSAYTALLMAKEHTGQERAVLAGAFASGKFTPQSFAKYIGHFAAQDAHWNAFDTYALEEQKLFYKNKVSGHAVDEVARLEKLAIDRMSETSLGADSVYWFKVMTDKIDLLKEVEDKLAGDLLEITREHKNEAQTLMYMYLAVSIVGLLVTLLFALIMIRVLMTQIGGEPDYAAAIVKQIATGDLTVSVDTRAGDQSSLLYAMKHMNESLRSIVTGVRGNTDSITSAALEIARDNAGLSQRTEEQASSLEETASSMEELTATVHQNAENAKQANQMAANASDIAVKGGQAVGDLVNIMSSISASSGKILDIISVIDSIAFQTNIIALNAAVEAARAGEQGRGFAVVAGEVRNLSHRSATAAREIKEMINDSVNIVHAGSKQVAHTGATMKEIVQAVKRVTDIMAEIAAASNEQSAGIAEVNQAINQMDEITQQNAALVEEAAASAESLEEQAIKLREAMSIFKLNAVSAGIRISAAMPATATHSTTAIHQGKPSKLVKAMDEEDEWKDF